MTTKHTSEPWIFQTTITQDGDGRETQIAILGADRSTIYRRLWTGTPPVIQERDFRRIVSCVNALQGLNPEAIPALIETIEHIVIDHADLFEKPNEKHILFEAARHALDELKT